MEVIFGMAYLSVFALLIFLIWIIKKDSDDVVPAASLGAIMSFFFTAGIFLITKYYNPSIAPIDVYRGRTALEITYRDSIAIDSIVVWKEEVK